ncbi:hypothetical protein GCM10020221_32590 [Streptomyces thioluteus]|uniref:Uncharacterized protein n=2 Tax=Streptomyces thioluteus TaxID=66431 RepID=A0ABP6JL29_STRTU
MCVEKTGNGHKAAALVGAVGDTGGDLSGPPLFDKFEVAVALNKNGNAGLKAYCNIAYDLNRMQNLPQYCDTSVDGSSSRGGWSGGGYVKYRLHNQGESYWGGINDSPTID